MFIEIFERERDGTDSKRLKLFISPPQKERFIRGIGEFDLRRGD